MISIVAKEQEHDIKCSIVGKPTLMEMVAVTKAIIEIFETCTPNMSKPDKKEILKEIFEDLQ